MRKHLLIPFGIGFATALLLVFPVTGTAQPFTLAEYTVTVHAVPAPGQPQTQVARVHDQQRSFDPLLPTMTAFGQADSGTTNTLGFAIGHALAVGAPGVLRASALVESQAVAQPNTAVGAGVVATAIAQFSDSVVFSAAAPVYQNLLIISGQLVLTGNMYGSGYVNAKVGGTGLNPQQPYAEWIGEIGRQKSAAGVYSAWTPGNPVILPFSFSANSGQAIDVGYWLSVYASAGSSFTTPCPSSGGLCNPGDTIASSTAASDYSHTLAWGGVSVTDWFGNPVGFTTTSNSGFDYSTAYVPEPGTISLMMIGLGAIGWRARRKSAATA